MIENQSLKYQTYRYSRLKKYLAILFAMLFLQINVFPGGRFFITFLVLILLVFVIPATQNFEVRKIDIVYYLGIFVISVLFFISIDDSNGVGFLKVVVAGVAFFIAAKYQFDFKKEVYLYINVVAILVLFLDLIYRLNIISFDLGCLATNFYNFKTDSIIFSDTNGVGMYCTIVACINYILRAFVSKSKYLLLQTIIFLFTLFTLSRSAIVSVTVLYVMAFSRLVFIDYLNRKSRRVFICLAMVALILSSYFVFEMILESISLDDSGATKIMIFHSLFSEIGYNLISDLFGYGYSLGGYVYSYENNAYGHAAIPLLVGQIGILGFLIYAILTITPIIYNRDYKVVFFAIFILSLSYIEPLYETLFILLGISINPNIRNDNTLPRAYA